MKIPIPLQNASNRAYKGIKGMIFKYELIPGQKIIYDELAAKLKLSKTPVINALTRLEQEEFVISFPNRGFFVKEIYLDEFENLYRIREALEMLAIEDCIKHGTPNGLKEIELAMITHRNYRFDEFFVSRKRNALDAEVHVKIAEIGGNKNLSRLLKQILEQISFRHRIEGLPPKRFKETPREHQAIFDAIKQANLTKAKKLMKIHVKKGKEAALRVIQKNKESYDF